VPQSRFHWSSLCFLFSAGAGFFFADGLARTIILTSLLLAYLVIFGLGVAVLRLNFFCRAVCREETGGMRVALTFDDGPDPEVTPEVLSVLASHELKATFFCIGTKILQHPELARRIVAEGHTIGNHTHHHFWWTNFCGPAVSGGNRSRPGGYTADNREDAGVIPAPGGPDQSPPSRRSE